MRVMRWYKLVGLTVLIILLLGNANAATLNVNASGGADSIKAQDAINNATASNTPMIVGGPCSYDKFRGTGRIISIHQTVQSKQQAVYSGYEGFEIKFKFMPVEPVNIENVRWVNNIQDILDREYLLLLTNSWYPGQNYLEKYSITENATFGGELLLITKGTCSPTIFRFDTINTTDYFETTAYNQTPTITPTPTLTPTTTSNLEQEVKDLKDRLNKTEENQTQQESRISG
ncbi:MAG: hypothetical protein OIN85_06840 [Candidatus Methanoperedens sp.]|nr:hypothetical protein [Candidatus Methanoperedens sp.]